MFTTEEQSRVLGKLEWNESLASPRPPLGAQSEAGRGPGERSSLRRHWVGGRRRPRGILLSRPLLGSTHDFFAEKRGEVGGVLFLFFVFFTCDLSSSPAPPRAAQPPHPPPAPGSWRSSPRGGRCPRRLRARNPPVRTPKLSLCGSLSPGGGGGQASSPAATSWVHSILDLKGHK